ncbi:MAG: hypothetical protein ACLU3I_16640 [Acutalibacteraceae bacterium]
MARRSLDAVGWQVDYIITHCAPTSIALMGKPPQRGRSAHRLSARRCRKEQNTTTGCSATTTTTRAIDEKHILLWEQIVRVI